MKQNPFEPWKRRGLEDLGFSEGSSVGLTPRTVVWPYGMVLAGGAAVACAIAAMIRGWPLWSLVAILLLGFVAAGLVSIFGWRKQRRDELGDRIIESLAVLISDTKRPSRRDYQFRSWVPGDFKRALDRFIGAPADIRIRFEARMDEESIDWRMAVADKVSQRSGMDYDITRYDSRACMLALGFAAPVEEPEPDPVFKTKATALAKQAFGDSAAVSVVLNDDDEPLPTQLAVEYDTDRKWAKASVRRDIEATVSALLPGRWRPDWNLTDDTVQFELRPTMPLSIPHPRPDTFGQVEDAILPYAEDEDGRIVAWDLKAAGPHMIVVGRTGTGKTVLIIGILIEAAARGWKIWVSDPKRVEFLGLRGWPNIQIVATQVSEQVAMIYKAWELMEYRYSLIEAGEADEDDFEPLIVCLDEYRDFVAMVTGWYQSVKEKGMPTKCPVFEWIGSLARKGRTARIHLLMGTQRPDADFLGGEMRDNFPARAALGSLSPQGAQMMWNSPSTGIALPKGVKGRATAVTVGGAPGEVQVYWTPDPRRAKKSGNDADIAILESLRPSEAVHPPLRIDIVEEPFDGDDYSEWQEVLAAELVEISVEEAMKPRAVLTKTVVNAVIEDKRAAESEDGYMPTEDLQACEVEAGDLVRVDGQWVAVEGSIEDPGEEDLWCIDYRTDEDESEMLAIDASEVLPVRKPDNSETEATGLLDEQ